MTGYAGYDWEKKAEMEILTWEWTVNNCWGLRGQIQKGYYEK